MEPSRRQSRSKKFWCRIFRTRHDLVGAICDAGLLGKTVKDKKVEVKVSRAFYGGAKISERAAANIMRKVTVGNLMGKEIVALAADRGFITEENTILIDGVPHAQFAKIRQR